MRLFTTAKPIGSIACGIVATLYTAMPTLAQHLVPDTTLPGENTVVLPCTTDCIVTGGATRGGILFHSFREFQVPSGHTVGFDNDPGIQNIITRVTWLDPSNVSTIDGRITANGAANLFLLNPNGIIVGAGAELNIGGSFIASTADSITFANGLEFSASNPQAPPLLAINLPVSLRFGDNPGAIQVQDAQLETRAGRTLALVGGGLTLRGAELSAPRGRVELGSVGAGAQVSLTVANQQWHLDYGNTLNFRDIELANFSQVGLTEALSANIAANGSQDIRLQGRAITLTEGSFIDASTSGAIQGGSIYLGASESVEISGKTTAPGGLFSQVRPNSLAPSAINRGGDITVRTQRLRLAEGAVISVSTLGTAAAGNIDIVAADRLDILGDSSPNGAFNTGIGSQSRELLYPLVSVGNAGRIQIQTGHLWVSNGAGILTSTRTGGSGGIIEINASESITLDGVSANLVTSSGIGTQSRGPGNAGDITLHTPILELRHGATITANGEDAGAAGNVTIHSDVVILRNGSSISTEIQAATGGNLFFNGQRLIVMLDRNNRISARAFGAANGGNIYFTFNPSGGIITSPYPLNYNNDVIANAEAGSGGHIALVNLLDLLNSGEPYNFQFLVPGETPESDFTARSISGQDGTVSIRPLDEAPAEELPDSFIEPFAPSNSCGEGRTAAGSNDQNSSFRIGGPGGLAVGVEGALAGDQLQVPPTPWPTSESPPPPEAAIPAELTVASAPRNPC